MRENDSTIDVTGSMDGSNFFGALGLGEALSTSPDVTSCVATRALEYAVGRPTEDSGIVEKLDRDFASAGYTIRTLFLKVATMPESWRVSAVPLDQAPTQVSLAH